MDYKNPDLPTDKRVRLLLELMTLEEKVAQMMSVSDELTDSLSIAPDDSVDTGTLKKLAPHGIGQVCRLSETRGGMSQTTVSDEAGLSPDEHARLSNEVQRYFMEETRLGIPAIFHEECLHGLVAEHATSTPQSIAMAGTFNPELAERVYSMIARESRLRGVHQALSPVLDIARDARWGRVEETFGEDPFLTSEMGIACIRGFQGDASFKTKEHIISTLKHFAAHGQPEGASNTAPANYSERILREVHFRPFREVIQKAGAMSVMTTYHEIDGVPVNANRWLVSDILRDEWGFTGFVVSDYYSIREMHERQDIAAHRVAADGKEAALLALKAGVNIELPFPDCYRHIPELLDEGSISMEEIDSLVGEILVAKFRMGLFDDPYVDPEKAREYCGSEANAKLALEAALQSICLLENQDEVLPLDPSAIKKIAVIGPNTDRIMLGGYSGKPGYFVSLLEGIRNRAGDQCEVVHAEGCRITVGGSWAEDEVTFPDPDEEKKLIAEALDIARSADVIVLGLGGNEQTSREAWNIHHLGDRSGLDLTGMQNELVTALQSTGKPMIAFLFNGRPLAINLLREKADAVLECWYLGQESGNACAKILFGDNNPGAKLPISFPRSAGHIPVFYNHKPSARRGYLDSDISPLYSFGYGLSYTSFEFSKPRLEKKEITEDESVRVWVDLTNTGKYRGDEVVQLYIRDEVSSVTRPVKELKDFRRVSLDPGEKKTVELLITPEKLAFYDINLDFRVEAGEFTVMTGSSSREEDLKTITLSVRNG